MFINYLFIKGQLRPAMNKYYRFCLFLVMACTLVIGCVDKEKKQITTTTIPQKIVVIQPFRYHKLIEVSPGQDYDVLSWGRGSSKTGSFEILHSDSSAAKYTTTTGDLDGVIVDVYNSDMDLDGNPEIIIQAIGKDTINYTNIYAYEFGSNKVQKLDFPKLNRSQQKGYRGNDNFYIKDGILIREFPVYNGNGKEAKPTGEKRKFQYGLRNNSFTIKQLNKDSANVRALKSDKKEMVKRVTEPKKTDVKKQIHKKKNTPTKKNKRKRRRHKSDEV